MYGGIYKKPEISLKDFVSELTKSAFKVCLKHSYEEQEHSVEKLELSLWENLRETLRKTMYYNHINELPSLPEQCSLITKGTKDIVPDIVIRNKIKSEDFWREK